MNYLKNTMRIVAFLLVGSLYAQQQANYSLYRYTMNVINPAYAGADGQTSFTTNLRSQWVNVNGAPETQSFFLAAPMNDKVGLGVSVVSDQVFIESQTSFNIDFSYKLQVSETANLFLGLKAGGSTYSLDRSGLLNIGLPSDPVIGNIDTGFRPNVGLGAVLMHENYYISLSAPRLLSSERIDESEGVITQATQAPHFYLSGGYDIDLSSNLEFRPSVMLRYVNGAPLSADITAAFRFYERFELGVLYRTESAVSGVMMLNLADWMDLGYAYESSTRSEIGDVSDGTHEVLVKFIFGRKAKPEMPEDMMED
jgi:type IX secretion system PorP/SprF family membrane protein